MEFEPVLTSKLSFDPKLVLETETLLESRLSLDPKLVSELGLAFESELVFKHRLSLVSVVASEIELDFELVFDPEPILKSLLSRCSLDPDALLLLVPEAFLCVDGLGLRETG